MVSRVICRRLAGLLAAVTALALSGGVAAIFATSGGRNTTSTLTAIARPRHVLAPPWLGSPSDPASASPAAATAPPKVAQKPPVVDGVLRTNVGSAHSPQTLNLLSSSAATMPPLGDAGALGVDVADYQHPHGVPINWPRVGAAGYKFAFIKSTEGDYYANPYYAADLAQAKAAGLYATGYHFAVPNVSGGASQADYAVRNGDYTADGRTLPLALDVEYNPYGPECYGLSAAGMVSWLSAFTAEVQRLTGQRPVIYTTADWWHACTGGSTAFGADPLWVAGYGNGSPPMPAGWASWTFWQYTSQGRVPGISGSTDVSYFLGGAVRLLDPGNQQDSPGSAIHMQVESLNAAAAQPPHFTASGLPPGLSISGGGLITGTITSTASGTYAVTVTAAYTSGSSGSVSFTWTVTSSQPTPPPSPSPSITPSSSPAPSASASSSPGPSASVSPMPSPSVSASSAPAPSPSPSAGSASAATTPGP